MKECHLLVTSDLIFLLGFRYGVLFVEPLNNSKENLRFEWSRHFDENIAHKLVSILSSIGYAKRKTEIRVLECKHTNEKGYILIILYFRQKSKFILRYAEIQGISINNAKKFNIFLHYNF